MPEYKSSLNTYEPKIESNENGTEEIEISNYADCCIIAFFVFIVILFIWFPIMFYLFFIHIGMRRVIAIDKRSKTLIIGDRGIIKCCCLCCIYDKKKYFLNRMKNVKIQVSSKNDSGLQFPNVYFINGYIYSQNDECQTLFSNIRYTDELYNKLVSFFQKYILTIDEPLEMVKNVCNDVPIDNNDIISKPLPNDDPAEVIAS